MKLETEDELDNLIICAQCHTLHKEIPIKDGSDALCTECGSILYRYNTKLLDKGLALSITGLIFFIIANLFPIVNIELLGHVQFITIPKTFIALFEHKFYLVGLLCTFFIFIFPLMIFTMNIVLFVLFKFKILPILAKDLLILLSYIKPWSMSDIFLISILVALVKLIGYAQIYLGVSFWALILFVVVDLYISTQLHISEIWMLYKRVYREQK